MVKRKGECVGGRKGGSAGLLNARKSPPKSEKPTTTHLATKHGTFHILPHMPNTNTISLLLLTFNCGKDRQAVDVIEHAVHKALLSGAASAPPQILVFGFEEVASILDASFDRLEPNLAPIQLGITSGLKGIYSTDEAHYVLAATSRIGAIATLVYVLDDTALPGISPIHVVETSTAGTRRGYFYSSLKGAAGVRLSVRTKPSRGGQVNAADDEIHEFTFVNAHLAANEGYVEKRNNDFYGIATSLGFKDGYGAYKPKSHTFFLGDLNYRAIVQKSVDSTEVSLLDALLEAEDDEGNPHDNAQYYSTFKASDELYHVMKSKKSFFGFTEAPVYFAPSFKFVVGSVKNYNTKRTPSWCDRILYLPYPTSPEIVKYSSIPSVVSSDHKPVYLLINVPKSPPVTVFQSDPADPKNLVVAPDFTPPSSRITLTQSENIGYYNGLGWTSDMAIGWGIFLAATQEGRIYAGVLAVAIFVLYLLS